eukprot:COSAG02_NODE_5495_length_4282_cov_2.570165_7_plen_79_part_00
MYLLRSKHAPTSPSDDCSNLAPTLPGRQTSLLSLGPAKEAAMRACLDSCVLAAGSTIADGIGLDTHCQRLHLEVRIKQ